MTIVYVLISLLTVYFFIRLNKSKSDSKLITWYFLGQFLFYFVPFYIIKITNSNFLFYYSYNYEAKLMGLILLVLSDIIVIISFISFQKNKKESNKVIRINPMIDILAFLIKLICYFAFIFSIYWIMNIGINNIQNNMILRAKVSLLGPFAILLMFPIGVSTYYFIRRIDGDKSVYNNMRILLYSIMAIVVAFFRGERTDLILIFLLPLIYLYSRKSKLKYLVVSGIILAIISTVYLMKFKVGIKDNNMSIVDTILKIFSGDLDRNWSYWVAISKTELFNNKIMENSLSGYYYLLLSFVPRNIAPFKGFSTETWFVYYIGKYVNYQWSVGNISQINWGITLSSLTESIINLGYLGGIIYSIFVGWFINALKNLNKTYKYTSCCITLVTILLSGYTLYNILIIYLPIVISLIIFERKDEQERYVKISIDNNGDI